MTFEISGFEEAKQKMAEAFSDIDNRILERLRYVGEECCNLARETGTYTDRTGNLRSSIGYRIYCDGNPYTDGGFKSIGGKEGSSKAHDALDEHDADVPSTGFAIVLVAGMSYGIYVESKGYDVITQTQEELDNKCKELVKELFK